MHAILVDVTRCEGCEACLRACEERHGARTGPAGLQAGGDLSAHRLLALARVDEGRFARRACMHCLDPSCVAACLVGGLTKSTEGPVLYDPEKCIGCRYCMLACPFHVPRYEWDRTLPFVRKCDLCADRLAGGTPPACVEACPHDALVFGERDELLREARRRIDAAPQAYVDRIWGKEELGGTCVLYVSDVDLDALGWPGRDAPAIPSLTEPLITKTPHIGLGVASALLGLTWIIRRRDARAAEVAAPIPNPASIDEHREEGK